MADDTQKTAAGTYTDRTAAHGDHRDPNDPRRRDPNRPETERNLVDRVQPDPETHPNPEGKPVSDLQERIPPITRPVGPAPDVDLDDLMNHVRTERDPAAAITTLWGEVFAHVKAAIEYGDPAVARRLVDDLTTRRDDLIAAAFANTPMNPDHPRPGRTPNPPEKP